MKKNLSSIIILLATISATTLSSSCTEKDITEVTNTVKQYCIFGRWQLQKVDFGFGGIKNCSEKNIEYQFFNTGILNVSDDSEEGGRGIFLTKGEHQYALNEKASQIIIDSSIYQYQIKDNELIIDTGSANDAPVYVFKLLNNDQ